jgi:hypothetical protein
MTMVQDEQRKTEDQHGQSEWRPRRSTGGQTAIIAGSALALCSAVAWIYLLTQPISVASLVPALAGIATALVASAAGAMAGAYYSMRYRLRQDELTVSWLWMRERIPLGRIDGLCSGRRMGKRAHVEGASWPGLYIGQATATEIGRPKFYGTTTLPSSVLVATVGDQSYALTPANLEGFRAQLVARLEGLTEEEVAQAPEPFTEGRLFSGSSVGMDRIWLGLMAASLAVLLASFALVAARLPGMPASIPLHFSSAGLPDMIVPRADALRIPIIGMMILGFNGITAAVVHAWQRDTGRVLAGATLLVELAALLAILRVVH